MNIKFSHIPWWTRGRRSRDFCAVREECDVRDGSRYIHMYVRTGYCEEKKRWIERRFIDLGSQPVQLPAYKMFTRTSAVVDARKSRDFVPVMVLWARCDSREHDNPFLCMRESICYTSCRTLYKVQYIYDQS